MVLARRAPGGNAPQCRRTTVRAAHLGEAESGLPQHPQDLIDADDDELIRIWSRATWGKPRAHGSDSPHTESDGFARPQRTMSAIGG